MSNTNKVIDMIANEALAIAHEKATFFSTTDRQFDETFKWDGSRHKGGQTLRVRQPNQYVRRQGSRVMDVQDQDEATTTITVATQDGVDMRFNSAELALEVNDPRQVAAFSKRYIEPAMATLISGIDGDYITAMTKATYQLVGTPGTVVGASSDITALGQARAKLNQSLAPKSERAFQIDSITMASIVNANKALFVPTQQIKEAFTEGFYSRSQMADFYENERTWSITTGSDHTTITVNDTVASGDTVVTTAGASVVVGTVFTFANVYDVHPETKAAYSHLKQFVVTAISGNDWTISPAMISTGAKQNISALPANSAAITCVGSASTSYRQNLMYHKDAFAIVFADLPKMGPDCTVKKMDGMSIRVWTDTDIRNDELLVRLDVLYGYAALRPEWACRVTN